MLASNVPGFMGNVGFLSLALVVISGCSQTLWYGSGLGSTASNVPQDLIMSANILSIILTTGRCEILWQALSLVCSISFPILDLLATRPLMGREALCFIERSAASSYFTKEGDRRVGGHTYNVKKKRVYTNGNGMELMKDR